MLKDTLKSWFTKGNAAEAGKTSDQLEGVSRVARGIAHTVCSLRQLYEVTSRPLQDIGHINYIIEAKRDRVDNFALPVLENLKSFIDEEKTDIKSLTVMGFCYSIVESGTLYKELGELKKLGSSLCKELEELKKLGGSLHEEFKKFKKDEHKNYQRFCCKLEKIVEDFKLEDLENKIRLLVLLREEMYFANIQKAYDNWYFNDLIGNINFRQEYVNKAVEERERPVRENFKENIDKCIRLAEQGKQIASRHFEESIVFQAYCKETKEANKALNINLIHYDKSKPIKISDILQQEKDISKLDIYCNKNLEIRAYRKDKKRYYKFEKGACYQMTSTWPVEDESGNTSTCTMVMNVDSTGITKIVKFDDREFNDESYKKDKKLIEQNKELYIENLSLCEAVEEFLKKQHGLECGREDIVPIKEERCNSALSPDVVPEGNISSNPTSNSGASEVYKEQPNLGENNENMNCDVGDQRVFRSEAYIVLENNYGNNKPDHTDLVPGLQNNQMSGGEPGSLNLEGNVSSNPTSNSGASEVHEVQSNLDGSHKNMGNETGNQPRCITEVHLVPGEQPTYRTTLYVEIRNNSQNKESNNDVQKCITSNPIKDLEAVRKQLRELRIELTTLEEELKQKRYVINKNGWPASDLKSRIASVENLVRVNKDLDNRYDELQGICEKLGELKEFICEVKERSKDQNIWHANDLSSLSNL